MELTGNEGYRLQPRINVRRDVSPAASPQVATSTINVVSRMFGRSSDSKCEENPNLNTCEKPASVSTPLIVAVVVVPVVLIAGLLLYLHRKNVQRQRMEDVQDPHKSLDFGMGDKKSNRKSLFMGGGEKGLHHKQSQLSMDMNLSSPYLLPPGLQQSRESLHSLARSLGNDHQDPYQQVTNYTNSETGSMRSMPYSKEGSSLYTKSSKRMSTTTGRSIPSQRMPPRTNSLPKSPTSPSDIKIDPFSLPSMPQPAHKLQSPVESEKDSFQPKAIIPEIGTVSDFEDKHDVPYLQQPQPARSKSPQFELPTLSEASSNSGTPVTDGFPLPPHRGRESNGAGLGLNFHLPKGPVPDVPHSAPLPAYDQQPADSKFAPYQPEIQTTEHYDDYEDFDRGRSAQRASFVEDIPPQQAQGLGVPHQDNKRLSVGFRPLPPDEVTESEDPEYRANRIRSFYKEYFEESGGKEPPPPMPAPPRGQQYYEDYDQGYLGEAAAYFDPETNAFVMPYAEPVTRRAMTPPPTGRQFRPGPGGPGPRGPRPHGPQGSIGGMSLPGGPRGRPRAGSAMGPRAGSAMGSPGSAMGSRAGSAFGPRPDSSASARIRQQPKKNLPPPAPLTTLPTPSKLKDDSFAIMGAIDFAPPDRIKDTAAGRSQSPFGERRPYSPQVPAATPVVSAFEELAALPSPHLLRKSSTFTGLDFAPPKKFKDADTMSDAGSIRSNRSGISAAQLGAIRSGAGRVSRLPGDTVFTQASLGDQLKPQWGMRQ